MKKRLIALLMCFSLVMAAGCGAGSDSNASDSSQAAKTSTAASGSDSNKLITIGFSQVGAESDWRVANTASMKSALSEKNGFKLIFADAQQKQENQIKAVRDFISQDVDVIAIAPVTETGWETVLGEAKNAGIPVIIVDRMIKVSDDSLFSCWVGSDFQKEGVNAAEWLANYIKEKGKTETQNVVVLQGTIGSSAEIGRTKGFGETIKKYSNFKVLAQQTGEFTQAKGQEVMESFLKQYKDINVVVAQNDNMAFGAIDALKAAGKVPGKDVTIVSFDAVKAAFKSMMAGDMNVSVECNPLHGPRVAELAKKLMNKDKVEKIQYVDEKVYPAETAEKELPNRQY
ncbi:periplasmic binding protein/LacI transcriptional regulator [Ruminiclostridium papyrosolvens DSM 2782]|uniref:Periplasmic binding protein/LacI transcriptional regulator n=1 Tax=Ruminiclostridium papyrosolvens DSM 2782 TaxID=588581 RepID=F1T8N8_9FIRM|nr:ABC transporter substrate-binding protein [Ruminiclostridium papyrosolvens]EGD48870.1 periplasmic binding protein/LacI transcriptional regulator [Ruminiclostridium papyrosolvens DSM 2782]WES35356.1 ABC transporter substrate-binding protein [Ruminiclostridium papyrosolvens DSM 2782]